jgi:hypothetical protein
MIQMNFLINREFFSIKVDNRNVFYSDRKCENQIRCIPKDDDFIKKIIISRNKLPHFLIDLFTLTAEAQNQYDNAKTDEEIAEIVKNDCLSLGARYMNDK